MENNKPGLERPQEKPRGPSRISWLITGLATVVIAGAVMVCLGLYQQNQRLEEQAQPATASELTTFNLQCGISVSLPKNWTISTVEGDSFALDAIRDDDSGAMIAKFEVVSEKMTDVNYSLERIKNLNAKEQVKFAERIAKRYESSELDSDVDIRNRRVIDYEINDMNGFFAVSLTTQEVLGQDKISGKALSIFFEDRVVAIVLVWVESSYSLLRQEIDTILNSIAIDRQ